MTCTTAICAKRSSMITYFLMCIPVELGWMFSIGFCSAVQQWRFRRRSRLCSCGGCRSDRHSPSKWPWAQSRRPLRSTVPLGIIRTLTVYPNDDKVSVLQKYNVYALQTYIIQSFWRSDEDNGYARNMHNKSASLLSMIVVEAALQLTVWWLGCYW